MNKRFVPSCIYLALFTICIGETGSDSVHGAVKVKSKSGVYVGYEKEERFFDRVDRVRYFLGIPYAEPPVGELRFRKPVSKAAIDDEYDATRHRDACLQPDLGVQPKGNLTYSEDCLYLSIYVPAEASKASSEPLAVMVWIHGGAYVLGSSDIYVCDHLAVRGNVIVVTINYRLGAWGFLCTGDSSSPGNYGIWDQHLAIRWVHDNIAAFGGDPDRITVFGESAGGSSAMFHALYPGNRGLLKRIVMQSGTANSWWASSHNDMHCRRYSSQLATQLNCPTDVNNEMMTCLRRVSADDMLAVIGDPSNGNIDVPIPFTPTRDNDFIQYNPTKLLEPTDIDALDTSIRYMFASVDVMIGMTSEDGSVTIGPAFGVKDPDNFLPSSSEFKVEIIPIMLKKMMGVEPSEALIESIFHQYSIENVLDAPVASRSYRDVFLDMYSDFTALDPLLRTLDIYNHVTESAKSPYVYYFRDTPSNHPCCPVTWFRGAGHCDEIPFVMGFRNSDRIQESFKNHPHQFWEEGTSLQFMMMWSNFAKTGDPNHPTKPELFEWKPYKSPDKHYLEISRSMRTGSSKVNLRGKYAHFWRKIIPSLVNLTMELSSIKSGQTCMKDGEC